ncbi:MAG TPA: PepSY domain-containing protein [Methanobacterium sp.]|nr:PepSY domain-containing protein [Methanobacterium sp.]
MARERKMIKKSALTMMVALMVLIVVVSGCTDNKNNTTNTSNNISNQTTNNTTSTPVNGDIISAEEAKAIAQEFVEEPGVTAETPALTTVDGRQIYLVPLYQDGEVVGEIEIDAVTGENLGGAGGAP